MSYRESFQHGSDKTSHAGLAEDTGAKVDMTDPKINGLFRNSRESGVLDGDHLNVSSPYSPQETGTPLAMKHSSLADSQSTPMSKDVQSPEPKHEFTQRCDSIQTSGGTADSATAGAIQQDINQLVRDLESGNFQQFLQDLINDLPTLLEASSGSSGANASNSGSDGATTSGPTGTPSDNGTAPSPVTGSDTAPPSAGANVTNLDNVPNATAQITDRLSNGQQESLGSGYFVKGKNGTTYLITDEHVTVDPGSVTATLANGKTVQITLAGTDPGSDLAAYTSPAFKGVSTLTLDPNLVSSGSAEAYVPLQQAGAGFYSGNLTGTDRRGNVQVTPADAYEQALLNQENPSDTMIGFDAPLQSGSSGSPILANTSQGWQVIAQQDDGDGSANFTTSSQDVQAFVNSLS